MSDSFETTPFILGVNNGHVQFAYNGWYKNLSGIASRRKTSAWASDAARPA